MAKKKIRPMGVIRCELEELYDEIIDGHGQQIGDEVGWLYQHLEMHRPDAREEFLDNTRAVYFYGHEDELIRLAAQIIKRRRNEKNSKINSSRNRAPNNPSSTKQR